MSDNRKVLVAKRKNDRDKCPNLPQTFRANQEFNPKKGTKRALVSNQLPTKNIANDRLKRLRTTLTEEANSSATPSNRYNNNNTTTVTKLGKNVKSCDNVRKRPQCEPHQSPIEIKQLKQHERQSNSRELNGSAFVFKQEDLRPKNIFTTSTVNPFTSLQNTVPDSSQNDEAMEWSTMDNDVSSVKTTSDYASGSGSSSTSSPTNENKFFVVVDTNIFLSHLKVIKDIVSVTIIGGIKPVIFIPWMVLEELDFIKEDSKKTSLRFNAQEANKYIEKTLSSKNERMKGQSLNEVNEQKHTGKCPDNKIIACCMQILENRQRMVLLTADINLKNKAHFNNIPVCSHTEIMPKVLKLNQIAAPLTVSKILKAKAPLIMHKMTELCSILIYECAKEAYGPACVKMPICQTPLESLQDCIAVFTKYWFPVFQEILMKQFKKAIDDLSIFINKHTNISDGSNEINDLLRLSVRVCLFLKDVQSCKDSIENTIRDLNNIKES